MKNPERLIGRKVRGFKFEDTKDVTYLSEMNIYIDEIGVIKKYYCDGTFRVEFDFNNPYYYPADQIEAHLVDDEIPTLSDGVMMLVSHNQIDWHNRLVFGIKNGLYYAFNETFNNDVIHFKYAKPIEPTKEEQLTAILGSSEKVSEIMELFKN